MERLEPPVDHPARVHEAATPHRPRHRSVLRPARHPTPPPQAPPPPPRPPPPPPPPHPNDGDAGPFLHPADPPDEELARGSNSASRAGPRSAGMDTSKPPAVCGSKPSASSESRHAAAAKRAAAAKSRFRGSPLVRTPFRARSRAPSMAGKRSDSSTSLHAAAIGHLVRVSEEPEPRHVRHGVRRQRPATRPPQPLFSVRIQRTARVNCCVPARPFL